MSNRKIPRSPVERGIFCFLFPISCVCPVLAGIPAILLSSFSSSISPSISVFSLCLFLRPFLRHCMPASFVCSFRRIVSGMFIVHCARYHPELPSPSLSFLLFTCGAILFLGCLSAIFSIYMYFSVFFCIFLHFYLHISKILRTFAPSLVR